MCRITLAYCGGVVICGLLIAGCRKAQSPATPPPPTAASTKSPDEQIAESLAKLSPEDRAAAEKQRVCPVTGERLGSMGQPVKVHVKDRDVFLCCDGCQDKLLGDPDTYLAKLDAGSKSEKRP